jgi:signal transduction histidine kinase
LLARFVLAALAIEVVLAPLLYSGVLRIVEDNEVELFVNDVRAYSRFLGDLLEFELPRASDEELVNLLDSIVLSHETTYAELHSPASSLRSSLLSDDGPSYIEDFAFGEHADHTYFLSIPLNHALDSNAVLRLGFDERPLDEGLERARDQLLWTLVTFVGLSVLLALLLGALLVGPLRDLQRASQAVASGSFDQHFGVSSRVSEIRELASDLEIMRHSLVHANRRLSAEISERMESQQARTNLERRLRHVQKLETVGTLAGGIAHEFNNVLVPIKFYTELAFEDLAPDDPMRADLKRVIDAAARAKSLVQKILTFSRQPQQEHYASIELTPIVEDAVALARDLFPATVQIFARLACDKPRIVGDATQIHQLVMNLLNNAFRAIGSEGGSITVELTRRTLAESDLPPRTNLAPGDYVILSVADTGHGLDPITRERIFEPFYTTRGPGEGTGLGLSVAHGIAASHGGDIGVESERGKGSSFSVYFPIGRDAATEVSGLGLNNVLYVAFDGAESEHRVTAAAVGVRTRTITSRAELVSLLTLEEGVDLWILDFGSLRPVDVPDREDLERWRTTNPRVLLLGPLAPAWQQAVASWPGVRHLLAGVDVATILQTVQGMLRERDGAIEELDDDSSTDNRRRAGRL